MSEVLQMRRRDTGLPIATGLSLPLEVVTEKLAFLGRTGSGKTYGAMKLAELMLAAGAQIGAIDPVGVWRALRVPAEPGGTTFDVVVFGGLYGDLPLEPTEHAGALIADLVTDRGLSFVLDVSQFIPSEQQRFVRAFGDRFFHRKKSAPSAVHLFLEECQEFIPENPSGDEAKTLGVMQRLWKLGRNFGIGGSLISQRPQEIAKKALNMSGTLFAFQMTGPQERAAVRKWVADQGIATDIEGVLQKLGIGQPHVESPTFLEVSKTVQILPRVTADLSSTPKVLGGSTIAKRALTPIDVEQLKTQLAATIEKAKAEDPKELRRQLAEKDREIGQLRRAVNQTDSIVVPPAKEVPALTDHDREVLAKIGPMLEQMAGKLGVVQEETLGKAQDRMSAVVAVLVNDAMQHGERIRAEFLGQFEKASVKKLIDKIAALQAPQASLHRVKPEVRPQASAQRPQLHRDSGTTRSSFGTQASGEKLAGGERKILTALAQHPDGRTKVQVALLTGYAHNGGGFNNYISGLRSRGFVEGGGDQLQITDAGAAALGSYDPLPTGRDLLAHWLRRLGKAERLILEALAEAHPNSLSKEEAGARTGYEPSGGGFNNALSKLRTLELIEGRGELRASADLFG